MPFQVVDEGQQQAPNQQHLRREQPSDPFRGAGDMAVGDQGGRRARLQWVDQTVPPPPEGNKGRQQLEAVGGLGREAGNSLEGADSHNRPERWGPCPSQETALPEAATDLQAHPLAVIVFRLRRPSQEGADVLGDL